MCDQPFNIPFIGVTVFYIDSCYMQADFHKTTSNEQHLSDAHTFLYERQFCEIFTQISRYNGSTAIRDT